MTALRVAVRAPERLRTLVVVGITAEREPRASVARRLMDPVRIDRADPAWAADLAAPPRSRPGRRARGGRCCRPSPGTSRRSRCSRPRQLRTIDPPTLVAVGDRDPFTPVDHAWRLSRSVLDGRLLVLPDAGHEAFAERPAIVDRGARGVLSIDRDRRAPRAPARPHRGGDPHDHATRPLPPARRRPRRRSPSSSGATRRSTCRSWPRRPGCASTRVQRVVEALGGETDLVLITAMEFDDRAALDAGLAVGRDARRRAEPARDRAGLATLLVLEDAPRPGRVRLPLRADPSRTTGYLTGPKPRDDPQGVRVTDVEPDAPASSASSPGRGA